MFRNLMLAAALALGLGLSACSPVAAEEAQVCETGYTDVMIHKALRKGVVVEVTFIGNAAHVFLEQLGVKDTEATKVEVLKASGDVPVKRVVGFLANGCMEDYADIPAEILDVVIERMKSGV